MNVEVASYVDLLKSTETLILREREVVSNDPVKSYPISVDVKIISQQANKAQLNAIYS